LQPNDGGWRLLKADVLGGLLLSVFIFTVIETLQALQIYSYNITNYIIIIILILIFNAIIIS